MVLIVSFFCYFSHHHSFEKKSCFQHNFTVIIRNCWIFSALFSPNILCWCVQLYFIMRWEWEHNFLASTQFYMKKIHFLREFYDDISIIISDLIIEIRPQQPDHKIKFILILPNNKLMMWSELFHFYLWRAMKLQKNEPCGIKIEEL